MTDPEAPGPNPYPPRPCQAECGTTVEAFVIPAIVGLPARWIPPPLRCTPCETAFREAEDLRLRVRSSAMTRRAALDRAGLPPIRPGVLLDGVTVDEFNRAGVEAARRFDLAAERGGLILYGDTGRGKTWIAEAMARTAEKAGAVVLFVPVPDFLALARKAMGRRRDGYRPDDIVDAARGVDLLILDDLGAEAAGEWAQEMIFRLLDFRIRTAEDDGVPGRPLVVTTNADEDALRRRLGGRVVSRLIGFCKVAELTGPDRRRE